MVARVVIGKRGASYGIWASPPGVDALTATDSAMILQMTNAVEQIVMRGAASPGQVVTHNVGQRPFVLITAIQSNPALSVNTFVRPWPVGEGNYSSQTVVVDTVNFYVGGGPDTVNYAVLRRLF